MSQEDDAEGRLESLGDVADHRAARVAPVRYGARRDPREGPAHHQRDRLYFEPYPALDGLAALGDDRGRGADPPQLARCRFRAGGQPHPGANEAADAAGGQRMVAAEERRGRAHLHSPLGRSYYSHRLFFHSELLEASWVRRSRRGTFARMRSTPPLAPITTRPPSR